MEINPENDLSRYGHKHKPVLRSVEDCEPDAPAEIEASNVDWMKVSVFSIGTGYSVGILAGPFINMFDSIKDMAIPGGIGIGVLSSIGAAIYVYKEEKRPD